MLFLFFVDRPINSGRGRHQLLALHRNNLTSSYGRSGNAPGVVHIELSAHMQAKARLFAGYMIHLFYFSYEKGLLLRLLRGVVYGRPALDIQMIHGTCDISDRREAAVKEKLNEIARMVAARRRRRQQPPTGAEDILEGLGGVGAGTGAGEMHFDDIVRTAVAGVAVSRVSTTVEAASAREAETDSLLARSMAETPSTMAHPLSRPCRTYSRCMLLTMLAMLTLQALLCVLSGAVYTHSLVAEWRRWHKPGRTGVVRRTTISVADELPSPAVRAVVWNSTTSIGLESVLPVTSFPIPIEPIVLTN